MAKSRTYRFGAGDDSHPYSGVWRLVVTDTDVYLGASKTSMGTVKVSLHQSGVWVFAATQQSGATFQNGNRRAKQWAAPAEHSPGVRRGPSVLVPHTFLGARAIAPDEGGRKSDLVPGSRARKYRRIQPLFRGQGNSDIVGARRARSRGSPTRQWSACRPLGLKSPIRSHVPERRRAPAAGECVQRSMHQVLSLVARFFGLHRAPTPAGFPCWLTCPFRSAASTSSNAADRREQRGVAPAPTAWPSSVEPLTFDRLRPNRHRRPRATAATPDPKTFCVTGEGSASIAVVDATTRTVRRRSPCQRRNRLRRRRGRWARCCRPDNG